MCGFHITTKTCELNMCTPTLEDELVLLEYTDTLPFFVIRLMTMARFGSFFTFSIRFLSAFDNFFFKF